MVTSNRTPPRFVPTLTAVVEVQPEAPAAAPVPPAAAPAAPASEGGNMIDDLHFAPLSRAPTPAAGTAAMQISEEDAFRLEEELLHRVLQRVDLSLEERLTDTVSIAVQRQLDAMMPLLRSEIETVLRSLVVEALAQELSETPGSAPPLRPPSLG
ncbi:hypothetical protein [Variovorax sp. OV329]|uniref:hypothetical protein n=1 Tax=Variovorax sp. OV329 TaxID=1882825 RepID=UPI0008EF6A58|nr:hypothetical protein [Variovorax sp. OV329]SFM67187.1 hypothetical protein SAMN05444747_107254 [Variovorax sp. OV329]